jgi:hypothetical protein
VHSIDLANRLARSRSTVTSIADFLAQATPGSDLWAVSRSVSLASFRASAPPSRGRTTSELISRLDSCVSAGDVSAVVALLKPLPGAVDLDAIVALILVLFLSFCVAFEFIAEIKSRFKNQVFDIASLCFNELNNFQVHLSSLCLCWPAWAR